MEQRVLELYVGTGHAMQEHVQLADGPGGGVVDLPTKQDVGNIAAGLLDKLAANDEHTAGAAAGIVNAQPWLGLEDTDHQSDNVARGIEVATLFACRLGEHVDEEFVGGPQQVRKLEVFVAQAVTAEMSNEVL